MSFFASEAERFVWIHNLQTGSNSIR